MRILDVLWALIGSTTFAPWSTWWNQGTGPDRMPSGTPPMDYNQLTQQQLLASFSDAIGPGGITPRALRNFVASTITSTPGGAPPSIPMLLPGWTTATRPNGANLAGPAIGYNYTLRQLDMWDDQLQQWVNPSFQGGTVGGAVNFVGGVTFNTPITIPSDLTVDGRIIAPNTPASSVGQPPGTFLNNGWTVAINQ